MGEARRPRKVLVGKLLRRYPASSEAPPEPSESPPATAALVLLLNTTYWVDDGEVVRISAHHENQWPEHRATRLLTADEHGETILACDIHPDFIGNVLETAEHVGQGY